MTVRLALRVEGDKWNAYVAKADTMEGAIWVGSIAMAFVAGNKKRKRAFIELMTDAMSDIIKNDLGLKVDHWKEQKAPEHERSKE
jgi:hypothetical protein